ncbi:MAG: MCP four helix bundle domain-containing protein, partial [Nitrosomonadales bacterium]|nr:MCP four helix bundle domain-containing protein [Nitrosomonadales bacterium]
MKISGMNFSAMKIGTKLGLGFGFILLLVVILSTFVVAKLSGMNKDAARIDADLANKARVSTISSLAKDNAISSMEMLLSSDSGLHARIIAQTDERKKSITENMESMSHDLAGFAQDEKLLAEVKKNRAVYVSGLEKVISLVKAGKREDATYVAGEEMIPMLAPLLKAVKNLDDHQAAKLDASTMQIKQTASSIRSMSIMIAVIVVLLGVTIAIMIVRNLMKQLGGEPDYAAEAVGKIASGDLSATLAIKAGDTSSLMYSLLVMQESLRAIVAEIKNIVEAAAVRGDFSKRMDMGGKQGYTKELSELLNQLSNTTNDGLNDVLHVANLLSKGDLTQTIAKDYPGAFGEVKNGINGTVTNLKELVGQIKD